MSSKRMTGKGTGEERMKQQVQNIMSDLTKCYPKLEVCKDDIAQAFEMMKGCYKMGGKLLICGNGGSAADADHIVGELMKSFKIKRALCNQDAEKLKNAFPEEGGYLADHLQGALPAISLVSHAAFNYAFINDVAADMVFAQQVYGYANAGDVLVGISTSGNAQNVLNAIKVAASFGIGTIGLTGEDGGKMSGLCDVTIKVPEHETYRVQEYHLPVYHALCAMIEAEFFS